MKRNIIVEVLDPLGKKVCELFDSRCSYPGQISNIKIQKNSKELTTLSFTLPTKIVDIGTGEVIDNPRRKFMTNEYQVRYTEDGEADIFLIKTPEETHAGAKVSETINCLHAADRLKTRNISDSRDAVIGNVRKHMNLILNGTGWKCGRTDEFYEDTLYEKYFDVDGELMQAPSDGSYGAYAEIRAAAGASEWDDNVGWKKSDVTVTSIGKNLCDGMIERGGIDETTGLPAYNDAKNRYRSINYLYVKPFRGMALIISGENVGGVAWHLYDENKDPLGSLKDDITIPLAEDSKIAFIKYEILADTAGNANFVNPPTKVQIETGTVATEFTEYSVPYSITFSLGQYDTIERNVIKRKTEYNDAAHTATEAAEAKEEYMPVYSIKMYPGGWIYAENRGPGNIGCSFAYTVTKETGGALREKYRSVGKDAGTSAFQELMDLEEVFGGRVVFHGTDKTVDYVRLIGRDTKFAFKPNYNAKSIKRTRSSNDFITRLYVINQETESGYIGIEDVNPLGTNFLMNLSHFNLEYEKLEALSQFEAEMAVLKPRSKAATDEYITASAQINNMVGQTPMGAANIASINGREIKIGSGKVYSYKDKDLPAEGDIAYIRGEDGRWNKFTIERYLAGSKTIVLDEGPENGSIIWWMTGIPAGIVGAQIIMLNTYVEKAENLDSQIATLEENKNPTNDEKTKLANLINNRAEMRKKISEINDGTSTESGLNENFARLLMQTETYNKAYEAVESIGSAKAEAMDRLDLVLGDVIYEGEFPQGEYASGQELELYEDARKYLEEHCRPQVEYSVTAVDRTAYGEEYSLENIGFGDIVYVYDDELGMMNIPAEVTAYTDEPLKKASNTFNLGNFDQNPVQMFEDIVSASKAIAESKYKYDRVAAMVTPDGTIAKDVIEKSLGAAAVPTKSEIEKMIESYFTTEFINNAGINWSRIVLLSDEITLRAGKAALTVTDDKITAAVGKLEDDISELSVGVGEIRAAVTDKDGELIKSSDIMQRANEIDLRVTSVANTEIGARNIIRNSRSMIFDDYGFVVASEIGEGTLGKITL